MLTSVLSLTTALPPTDTHIDGVQQEHGNIFSANLSRVEGRMNHKLRQTERRILDYLEERIRPLNQTLAMAQMERMAFMVYEQQEYAKETMADQQKEIERLRSQSAQQEDELQRMRATLDAVRGTVEQLSTQVQVLQEAGQSENVVTSSEIDVKPTPSIDNKYPSGKYFMVYIMC